MPTTQKEEMKKETDQILKMGPSAPEAPASATAAIREEVERQVAAWCARTGQSREAWERARANVPGGVSGNFRLMNPYPMFAARARGSRLFDLDGNEYIDFMLNMGSQLVGHAHPAVVKALGEQAERGTLFCMPHVWEQEVARQLASRFGIPQWRYVNTGTEATMTALRIARGYTGKKYIVKFEGHYHGHNDQTLVTTNALLRQLGRADRGVRIPASQGIPEETYALTLMAIFNNLDSVKELFARHGGEIAAVIAEPIMMDCGCIEPEPGFFAAVRDLCHDNGALLIYDEVKTGCKVAPGGASELYGVVPDLVCVAKALAGGLPLGAVGGSEEVMQVVGDGSVLHVGTFGANPLVLYVAHVVLRDLLTEEAYRHTFALNRELAEGYRHLVKKHRLAAQINAVGPCGMITFTDRPLRSYREFMTADEDRFRLYWFGMMNQGILPAHHFGGDVWTVSIAHTRDDIAKNLEAFDRLGPRLR
ncbi:MAG TPA: aspartate aminotransferase family protein [Candidatus Polarisedimenticolia bacterium]|jgi:glutamate-1-semialdehyde 2,1-aminomutase|nr:aspartate aminotransferase family protein [Candidatus Polarisedimenticolia bacterium]